MAQSDERGVSMTIAVLEALTFGLGRMVAAAESAGERLCLLTGNRGIYRHELALPPTRWASSTSTPTTWPRMPLR